MHARITFIEAAAESVASLEHADASFATDAPFLSFAEPALLLALSPLHTLGAEKRNGYLCHSQLLRRRFVGGREKSGVAGRHARHHAEPLLMLFNRWDQQGRVRGPFIINLVGDDDLVFRLLNFDHFAELGGLARFSFADDFAGVFKQTDYLTRRVGDAVDDPGARLVHDLLHTGKHRVDLFFHAFSGYGLVADPNGQLTNLYQIINHATLIRGAHNFKFGADLRKTNFNDVGDRNARGSLTFTGALTADPQNRSRTGVSLADMLLGLPLSANGSSTPLAGNYNSFGYYFFMEDDWKISSRLTLNLGLRYELDTRFEEVQNRISYFDRSFPGGRLLLAGTSQAFIAPNTLTSGPSTPRGLFPADKKDWGPRFGLAFRPFNNSRTAIRAGYGIFYTMADGQTERQLERNPPGAAIAAVSADQDANSTGPNAIRVADLFPATGTPASRPLIYTDIGFKPASYIQQWNLTIQQSLPGNTVVELGYLGSKGTHLIAYTQGNQAPLDADPSHPTLLISRQPFPLWGASLRTTQASVNSSYQAAFVKVERRLSHGLSFLTHFTFSKDLSTVSDINESAANFYNLRVDRGRSLNDIGRNALVANTWEIPVGPGKSVLTAGPLSKILGNWMTSSIVSLRGGFPFGVQASGDVCNCSLSGDERAQQVGDPRSGFTQSRVKWFNTAAFIQPRQGTFGNSGQHILSGPGSADVDFTLFRIMRFRERASVQIR